MITATTTLRKVGGSVMLAVPPLLMEALNVTVGAPLTIECNGYTLVIKPARPRYNEADLLAKCDPAIPWTDEDRQWLDNKPAGLEIA
jgi:antitoxin ChpS